MSRSRSAQPSHQHQPTTENKTKHSSNYKAQPTIQVPDLQNYNQLWGQNSLVPSFPVGFIHVQLGFDKNGKAELPKSNQTMRQKRRRQINSHLTNPNHLVVLQVPQNHSNLLQVPELTTKLNSQKHHHTIVQQPELQSQKVQMKHKEGSYSQYVMQDQSNFIDSMGIDASKVERYFEERQKRSEKYTLKTKKQARLQNSGVYLICVSESVSDNKGMDKVQSLSNHTKNTNNESSAMMDSHHDNKHKFIHTPPSIGTVPSFNFKRQKVFWRSFVNPEYTLSANDGAFVINAKKQYAHFNSYYSIATSSKQYSEQDGGYLGYLQGNFTGSQFNLYQRIGNKHELVATIYYVSEFSCSQSYRSIQVYLKHPLLNSLGDQKGSLKDLYSKEYNGMNRSILKLVNKQPVWSSSMNCFVMNFHGKSKYGSIKNIILVEEGNPGDQIMLFCKTGEHDFWLEMGYPLTSFAAMGVILSSFDFKLCCQ